jgi:hypothetical protein
MTCVYSYMETCGAQHECTALCIDGDYFSWSHLYEISFPFLFSHTCVVLYVVVSQEGRRNI